MNDLLRVELQPFISLDAFNFHPGGRPQVIRVASFDTVLDDLIQFPEVDPFLGGFHFLDFHFVGAPPAKLDLLLHRLVDFKSPPLSVDLADRAAGVEFEVLKFVIDVIQGSTGSSAILAAELSNKWSHQTAKEIVVGDNIHGCCMQDGNDPHPIVEEVQILILLLI